MMAYVYHQYYTNKYNKNNQIKNSGSPLLASPFGAKIKKFQFTLKIGWRALAEGEPTKTFPNWRRDRDSNPGYPCGYAGFRDRCFQPLSHLSVYSVGVVFEQFEFTVPPKMSI